MLSRDTEWRQGSILTKESARALIPSGLNENSFVIVISHDCDLSHEKEESVEVIVGSFLSKADHNFTRARNVRRLHLTYESPSQAIFLDLTHSTRKNVPKSQFASIAKLDPDLTLSREEKLILQQWLAARYARPALPNAFENRLRKDKKFEQKFNEVLSAANVHSIGVFFDLGEDRFVELPLGAPYFLRISVLYDNLGGPIARKVVEECVARVVALFYKTFDPPAAATEIALESCQAIADTSFSAADLRKTVQWRAEYISLREDPPTAFLSLGERLA